MVFRLFTDVQLPLVKDGARASSAAPLGAPSYTRGDNCSSACQQH